ncbi:MAG TPA: DUF937 domain-containing protein [Tessaracoccus flavescens]|uniref:DUF937 domain-containing protein n=1 Tax=Tessaracoccus flavescens TaxID=399497 RepID=A0A921EPF0_9ACTN|nr:DUF937 domain-containing protein [Tessaracoccus flavescens]
MLDYNEILSNLPIDQLAAQVGESPEAVEQAVQSALPALLMGMGANAQDPAGEASLRSALSQHNPGLLDGGIDLDNIDTADGRKITHHIFGDNEDQVINQLGGLGGANGSALIQKLLPILAPIVMAWLAGKFMGQDARQGQPQQAPTGGGGGLGDILGQILGGGSAPQAQRAPQQAPQQSEPNFRQPADSGDGGLRMPMPEPRTTQQQQSQPQGGGMGGGLGGGILGDILGGLLGGGRR